MTVLRIHRCGFVLASSILLAACSGSSSSDRPTDNPIDIGGSVGDGPVVGAEIRVTDATGRLLEQHTSDATAGYRLTVPPGAKLPVLVTAAGGTDLVTGRALDFTLVGAVLDRNATTVNLSPHSTVAVRAAQCSPQGLTAGSLAEAWERVHEHLAMGLDFDVIADPMSEEITRSNVEAVVLASEAFGETVRRTVTALAGTSDAMDGDAILGQVACDLMGQPAPMQRVTETPRVLASFKSAELVVRLETLAGRLEVDGESAVSRMNDSIRTIMSDFTDPSVASVPVTEKARDRAVSLMNVFRDITADDSLAELAVGLGSADPEAVSDWVDGALDAGWHGNLVAMANNVALADDTQLAQIAERRDEIEQAEAPTVALAAQSTTVAAGERATLSWAVNGAEMCHATGGWEGELEPSGLMVSQPLSEPTSFRISCVGPGGVAQQTVVVGVELDDVSGESDPDDQHQDVAVTPPPVAEPDPAPEPAPAPAPAPAPTPDPGDGQVVVIDPVPQPQPVEAPVVNLHVANTVVAVGERAQLRWSSERADTCVATGGWGGTKKVDGSQHSVPVQRRTTYTLTCSGQGGTAVAMVSVSALGDVNLSWTPPSVNTDSTPLTDLAGYRLYYGAVSGDYNESLGLLSPSATSRSLSLPSGSYYFAVTAVDSQGNESAYSNEVMRIVN